MTVVIEETLEGEPTQRMGRWEYSAQELSDLLEPIGNAQGYHLRLAWDEHPPKGNALDVYVRFAAEDGTTMVNTKQIHLRRGNVASSAWTPR
jgi:hypothetical protein